MVFHIPGTLAWFQWMSSWNIQTSYPIAAEETRRVTSLYGYLRWSSCCWWQPWEHPFLKLLHVSPKHPFRCLTTVCRHIELEEICTLSPTSIESVFMYVYAVFVFSVIGLVVACRSTSTCNNFLLALLSAFVGYSLYRFNKMSDAQGQLSA